MSERRFLCDQMLVRLGKWLRAAGHDTDIAGRDDHDGDILDRARTSGRLLLTCDRRLKRERAPDDDRVLVLSSSRPEVAAPELTAALGLDWQHKPFTRCLEDNTPLRPASEAELAQVPARARALPGPVMACPHCGRVYWPGSHVRRMQRKLAAWQALAEDAT